MTGGLGCGGLRYTTTGYVKLCKDGHFSTSTFMKRLREYLVTGMSGLCPSLVLLLVGAAAGCSSGSLPAGKSREVWLKKEKKTLKIRIHFSQICLQFCCPFPLPNSVSFPQPFFSQSKDN